jgi:hypothetical protein
MLGREDFSRQGAKKTFKKRQRFGPLRENFLGNSFDV